MNVLNMIGGKGGSAGLTPTIRVYAPSGSTLTCDGKSYTLGSSETYHDFSVSCEKVSVLPSGYTGLEYIQSSGTQYIDTGCKWTSDVIEVACGLTPLSGVTNPNYFGAVNTNTGSQNFSDIRLGTWSTTTGLYFGYGGLATFAFSTGTLYEIDAIFSNGTFTGTYNGNSLSGSASAYSGNYVQKSYNPYICSVNTDGSALRSGAMQMNYFKMYDNGTLVRNFIPCKNASSVVGMYDTVSKTFFGNSGTGNFTASTTTKEWTDYPTYTVTATLDGVTKTSEVTVDKVGLFETTPKRLPSGYTEVEYIESSGTQYIDTGILASSYSYDNEIRFVSDFIATGITSEEGATLLGTESGLNPNNRYNFVQYSTDSNVFSCFGYGSWQSGMLTSFGSLNTKYNCDITAKTGSQTIKVNGTVVGSTSYTLSNSYVYSLYLFAQNKKGTMRYPFVGNVYSASIYIDSVLKRDFVPCINDSTEEYGMYDLVSNTFFGNSGSGAFSGGDAV